MESDNGQAFARFPQFGKGAQRAIGKYLLPCTILSPGTSLAPHAILALHVDL